MTMIRLTQWESGLPFTIRPDVITALVALEAATYDDIEGRPPQKLGQRTRVDYQGGSVLVTEPVDEIERLIEANAETGGGA